MQVNDKGEYDGYRVTDGKSGSLGDGGADFISGIPADWGAVFSASCAIPFWMWGWVSRLVFGFLIVVSRGLWHPWDFERVVCPIICRSQRSRRGGVLISYYGVAYLGPV